MKKPLLILVVLLIATAVYLMTEEKNANMPVIQIVDLNGPVLARNKDTADFTTAQTNQLLGCSAAIKTGEEAHAGLRMVSDGSSIKLGQNSYLEVSSFNRKELLQKNGTAVYQIEKQNKNIKIHTPQGTATVLGTVFRVEVAASQTLIFVQSGKVGFTKENGPETIIEKGQKFASSDSKLTNLPESFPQDFFENPLEEGSSPEQGSASESSDENPAAESATDAEPVASDSATAPAEAGEGVEPVKAIHEHVSPWTGPEFSKPEKDPSKP